MRVLSLVIWILLVLVSVDSVASPARALVLRVGSGDDAVDAAPGDGVCASAADECTLRAAIQEANAMLGVDLILLPDGVVSLSLAGEEDASLSGDLDVTETVEVRGEGVERSVVDCGGVTAFMEIVAGVSVVLSRVTVRQCVFENGATLLNRGDRMQVLDSKFESNGSEGVDGLVFANFGILQASRVSFLDNFGTAFFNEGRAVFDEVSMVGNGPAIDTGDGTLQLIRSQIQGNASGIFGCPAILGSRLLDNGSWGVACPGGGLVVFDSVVSGNQGIGVLSDGSLRILDSAIASNGDDLSARGAQLSGLGFVSTGGVGAFGPALIENSTIVDNRGSGVDIGFGATLRNVTVSGNGGRSSLAGVHVGGAPNLIENSTIFANLGGGVRLAGDAVLDVRASIVFGSTNADGADEDCRSAQGSERGVFRSGGGSLLSTAMDGCDVVTVETDLIDVDPRLGPLADNGGRTLTHALMEGSPAVDAGVEDDCPSADQRGIDRPQGMRCDIGAVERVLSCGDGIVNAGEACDDGNQIDGDCCSSLCRFTEVLAGDCNGDGVVRINELTTAVNLAISGDLIAGCRAIDRDDDFRVVIGELIAAVRVALLGEELSCPVL